MKALEQGQGTEITIKMTRPNVIGACRHTNSETSKRGGWRTIVPKLVEIPHDIDDDAKLNVDYRLV